MLYSADLSEYHRAIDFHSCYLNLQVGDKSRTISFALTKNNSEDLKLFCCNLQVINKKEACQMPWKNLSFNIDKCVGCRICELACSIEKLGKINPRKARLHAIYDYPFDDVVFICRQCVFAPCANQCKENAIKRDNRTGAWIVDSTKCIGCGACVEACPFGVITVSSDNNVAVKCDLCNGNPQCVLWCPTGALTYGLKERFTQERRENFAKKYTSLLKPQKFRATLNGGKSYDARAKVSNE